MRRYFGRKLLIYAVTFFVAVTSGGRYLVAAGFRSASIRMLPSSQ